MKKAIAIILSIMLILAITFPAAALSTIAVKSIKLSSSKITLKVGQTLNLKVTFTPATTSQKKLTYVTGNKKVVTVGTTGKITGVNAGTTTITVYTLNKKIFAKCDIIVSQSVKPVTIDPLSKYNPAITLTSVRAIDSATKFLSGESMDSNIWTKLFESQLGISVKNRFTVNSDQYEQKLNITIASNDLPDIFLVNGRQLQMLAEEGSIRDLSDVYDKYAAPLTKQIMTQDQTGFDSAKIKGKLMALPNAQSAVDGSTILYIRSDWLAKVNLPEPKTMKDFLKVCEAFTTKDPDGNGKADTYAMTFSKDFLTDYLGNASGFFNAYHAYPTNWVRNATGKLVFGGIQPEVKAALQQLNVMYKAGQIDQEFGVKDAAKVGEVISSEKAGIHFGAMWNPLWPFQTIIDKNPNADFKVLPIPSIDYNQASTMVPMPVSWYYAVKKDCSNPEAAIKLLNLFIEKMWGKTADAKYFDITGPNNDVVPHKFPLIQAWPARKNLDLYLKCKEVITTKDTSKLSVEEKTTYGLLDKFLNGDKKQWGQFRVFGEGGSYSIIDEYTKNNAIAYDGFYGSPTPTMIDKKSTLDKMQVEIYTKIIMGAASIDEFDKFVENWKKLGGNEITKEVADWAAEK